MFDHVCPGCSGALTPAARDGAFTCASCKGRYLEGSALRALGVAISPELRRSASESPRACPSCDGPMEQVVLSAVTLDLCNACGSLYFDSGELESLRPQSKSEERLECDGCGTPTAISALESLDGKALCEACLASAGGSRAAALNDRDFYAAERNAIADANKTEAVNNFYRATGAGYRSYDSNVSSDLVGLLLDVFL